MNALAVERKHFSFSIYREFLEEISFLYAQRIYLRSLGELDWIDFERFEYRLDDYLGALRDGGRLALECCEEQFFDDDFGELYGAVSLFCRQNQHRLFEAVLEQLDAGDAERVQAVADALCFEMPEDWTESLLLPLLKDESELKGLACRVIGFRRLPFADALVSLLNAEDPELLKAVLWALGRLQNSSAVAEALPLVEHADAAVQEAAVLMMARSGAVEQISLPHSEWPPVVRAVCGLSVGDLDFAIPEQVLAAGLLGDASSIPDLITALVDEAVAKEAALALYLITGTYLKEEVFIPENIQEEDLFEEEIEAFRAGTLYPEGEWPGEEVERLSQNPATWQEWLDENGSLFKEEGRYRNGELFSKEGVLSLLKADETPDLLRKWCAEELAIQFGVRVSFETEMRVRDQWAALEEITK